MHPPSDHASAELDSVLARFQSRVAAAGRRRGFLDAEVDELTQEVRIRLWKASQRGENLPGLSASFVYRTALNAATDMIRRSRARREDRTESLDAFTETESHMQSATADASVIGGEIVDEVEHALVTLSDTRQPVVRMYLAGYDREEIAALLRWTEAKTRNLLYRGLSDLRTELSRRGFAPEGP